MAGNSLSDDDLRIIIQASAAAGATPHLLMLLAILTGQRVGELANLEWGHIERWSSYLLESAIGGGRVDFGRLDPDR